MTNFKSSSRPNLGLRVADLFSGAGGLSQGFRSAGYEVPLAIDIDPDSCATYSINHSVPEILCTSVTKVRPIDFERKLGGEVDVIAGGPSCQGFSTAGRRYRDGGWVRSGDDRNHLWIHMLKVVKRLKPKAFLMENVPGMLSFRKGQFGERILRDFRALGYDVKHNVLLAADYGVPQLRRRVFIVGVLEGFVYDFPSPTHLGAWRRDQISRWENERLQRGLLPHLTCWEAIADLPELGPSLGSPEMEYTREPASEIAALLKGESARIFDHEVRGQAAHHQSLIEMIPPGGTWRDVPPHLLPDRFRGMRRSDSTTLLGRLDPTRPAYTLTTQFNNITTGCNIHPFEDRVISVREGARLQTFPDDYRFVGSVTSRCRQIGNAVPPLLAQILANSIAEALLDGRRKKRIVRLPVVKPASLTNSSPNETTRRRMKRQKRIDTRPEVALRKGLHARGLRYRIDERPIPSLRRNADLVFRSKKVAVFVDGCFWHGCEVHARPTKSNTKWWADKISRNKERDLETTRLLKEAGWTVIRIWEHEPPARAVEIVLHQLNGSAKAIKRSRSRTVGSRI